MHAHRLCLTCLLVFLTGSAKDAINVEQAFKALVKEALANSQFETKCVFLPFAILCQSAYTIVLALSYPTPRPQVV